MTIECFIADEIRKRLDEVQSLVVYDPDRIYADIAKELQSGTCTVIDGSISTIEGRQQAEAAFRDVAADDANRLLVYLPTAVPTTDEERRLNPYQAFALAGGVFPEGDGQESFHAMCRRAAPERTAEVDKLFVAGRSDFATVNKLIEGGSNWPKLKTILKVESSVEITVTLLAPPKIQDEALKSDESWVPEMKDFLAAALGLKLQTKSRKRPGIAAEVWRFILFSEFTFDLPGELPSALRDVPRADSAQETMIYAICDRLRSMDAHQVAYMEAAITVADDLQLLKHMQGIKALGDRDTFAFEERIYLDVFKDAALSEKYDQAETVSSIRNNSVWVARNGERKHLWTIADRALSLIKLSRDLLPAIKKLGSATSDIIDFYCDRFRKLDTLLRSFEQAVVDAYGELDILDALVAEARLHYRTAADRLQTKFIETVERDGWPADDRIAATEVFNQFVAPSIKERKRMAYFMIDALRYELATELLNELSGTYETELNVACAQLPGTTQVGMAALMPKDAGKLSLEVISGKLVPKIGDAKVRVPDERLACIQSVYGDMCRTVGLDDLITKKIKPDDKTMLLVVKTTDIDSIGELSALEAYRMIPQLMQKLIAGIRKLAKLGFEKVVFATDHGFIILDEIGAGNVIGKPSGDWDVAKDRFLLGTGASGPGVRSLNTAFLGIPYPGPCYAVPASLGIFSRGNPYYHGGLSLQECILPVLSVDLCSSAEKQTESRPEIRLSYKGDSTCKTTTRRPMIEIAVFQTGLFDEVVEFSLNARADNLVVGEAGASDHVNNATGLVTVKPNAAVKVPLRMDDDYHGSFEVKAVDPVTSYTYAVLKLKTDYVE